MRSLEMYDIFRDNSARFFFNGESKRKFEIFYLNFKSRYCVCKLALCYFRAYVKSERFLSIYQNVVQINNYKIRWNWF